MEFKVEHPHFVENKITWEISGLKSTLKYNGKPIKLKWGKTKLFDDYGIEREVKISDNFFNSPMIVIDKIEKIKNKLYVYYNYTGYGRNYSPALIEDVEEFDLMEKGNLFYIKLKFKNQEERVYCYEKA